MTTLTLEYLLEIHALAATETGGSMGLRDLGRLELALGTQRSMFSAENCTRMSTKKPQL